MTNTEQELTDRWAAACHATGHQCFETNEASDDSKAWQQFVTPLAAELDRLRKLRPLDVEEAAEAFAVQADGEGFTGLANDLRKPRQFALGQAFRRAPSQFAVPTCDHRPLNAEAMLDVIGETILEWSRHADEKTSELEKELDEARHELALRTKIGQDWEDRAINAERLLESANIRLGSAISQKEKTPDPVQQIREAMQGENVCELTVRPGNLVLTKYIGHPNKGESSKRAYPNDWPAVLAQLREWAKPKVPTLEEALEAVRAASEPGPDERLDENLAIVRRYLESQTPSPRGAVNAPISAKTP